jgi:hypothetical protein
MNSLDGVDFRIVSLCKMTTVPAQWTVVIEKAGKNHTAIMRHKRFCRYESFVEEILGQNSVALTTFLKNHEWRALVDEAITDGRYEERGPRKVIRESAD